MGYSMDAIKARLTTNSDKKQGGGTKEKNSTKYFKPVLGPNNTPKEYDIRFCPLTNSSGEPIQTIVNYGKLSNTVKVGMGKLISPSQFGMEDPIAVEFEKKRNHPKGKNATEQERKESWAYAKVLKPEDFCAALVLDRNAEEEGWLLWEFKPDLRDAIYGVMANKDYAEEQMFDADSGYDWTLTVAQKIEDGKPKSFNGFPCKEFTLLPRRKSSKLHADKKIKDALMKSAYSLEEYYKKFVKTPEELTQLLQAYQEGKYEGGVAVPDKAATPVGTDHMAMRGVTGAMSDKSAEDEVDSAFNDLKEEIPF